MQRTNLENELLKTLSFYEAMSLELIYLDLNKDFLLIHSELTLEDLHESLKQLTKNKFLKEQKNKGGQITWIRCVPKKSLWKRLSKYFFS